MSEPGKIAASTVPAFDGTNYKTWSNAMIGLFRYSDSYLIVMGKEKLPKAADPDKPTVEETKLINSWNTRNQRAISYMQLYSIPSLIHYFKEVEFASVLWNQFATDFKSTSILAESLAFRGLLETKFADNDELNAQIQSFQTNLQLVEETGLKIERSIRVMIFLWALPASYNLPLSAWLATADMTTIDIKDIVPKILEEERRRKGSNEVSVSKITQTKRHKKGPCQKCGKTNHSTENHWDTKPGTSQKKKSENKGNQGKPKQGQAQKKQGNGQNKKQGKGKRPTVHTLQVATQPVFEIDSDNEINVSLYTLRETSENVAWLIDSGATKHITNSLSDFAAYQPAVTPGTCSVAGKKMQIEIKGQGTVILDTVLDNGANRRITLNNVLYVPEATSRFFAPSKALQIGCVSKITADKWILEQNGTDILHGYPDYSGLYWLKGNIIRSSDSISSIKRNNYDLWHNRLGHPGKKIITNLHKYTKGLKSRIQSPAAVMPCHGCELGRSKRKAFPASDSRAKYPLELTHCDLIEFPTLSMDGYRYGLTCLDDASSFGLLFYLKHKNDTLTAFKEYKAWAENQTNKKMKKLRSDGGSEFMNREFRDFLKSEGIEPQFSTPYSPQQNGRAERWQQTIKYKAEALRHQAGLSNGFWKLACEAAVYITNRIPNQRLNWITPIESFTGERPDVSNFRVFGCRAYVHLPEQRRQHKPSPKAAQMIFIGYELGVKGYQFWDNQRIVIARDAVFAENTFPRRLDKSSSKEPLGDLNNPLHDIDSPFEELGDFGHDDPDSRDDNYHGQPEPNLPPRPKQQIKSPKAPPMKRVISQPEPIRRSTRSTAGKNPKLGGNPVEWEKSANETRPSSKVLIKKSLKMKPMKT